MKRLLLQTFVAVALFVALVALGTRDYVPPLPSPLALDLVLDGKVAIKPFVEMHPLDDINRVFTAVHHHEIKKRAVMVPTA